MLFLEEPFTSYPCPEVSRSHSSSTLFLGDCCFYWPISVIPDQDTSQGSASASWKQSERFGGTQKLTFSGVASIPVGLPKLSCSARAGYQCQMQMTTSTRPDNYQCEIKWDANCWNIESNSKRQSPLPLCPNSVFILSVSVGYRPETEL